MATGVTKKEVLSPDALVANLPHRDPHPLPGTGATAALHYEGRLSEAEILAPLSATFRHVATDGSMGDVRAPASSSLMLTDNLFGLHALREAGTRVTLFYLDPPYNTGMDFQSRQLQHAYNDKWSLAAYVESMRRRFVLMRELLTDDGSIYVHIDHRMLAHLKVVMDEVFGVDNFRNLITRRKCSSKNFTKNSYANTHDYILFYTKTSRYKWKQPTVRPDAAWLAKEYDKTDQRGRYKLVPVHAPGTRNGETGKPWRGKLPPAGKHWQYAPSKLDELDAKGEIHWSKTGNPRRKVYLMEDKSVALTDYWDRYRDAHHQSIAVTGYPTEKNLDMLKMIVSASSDPGDLVVDPFAGSSTALEAAASLGRRWIGMDKSFAAIEASTRRLRYGAKPMGDFVERGDSAQPLNLFPATETADPAIKTVREPIPFSLLVDEELFAIYPDQLVELASLCLE
ncbi:site-specific DNA-methyltransferase [Brevundimonas sp.]|uniref:site-specific DNA-methyltransferase n=1 Tax=Brevundimonas sp. TaxID=1871086 RepID=UPI0028A5F502|nr:site-specific DNA-methyltransferase [Brevundimonas sp.]